MEGQFQTSFIPKKPITPTSSVRSAGVSLFTLLGVIIFLASIALAAAVFLYQNYLTSNIATMKSSFQADESAFDPTSISTYTTLSKRMAVAKILLQNHMAVSTLFSVLEEGTLKTIRFTSFSYTYLSPQKATLSMAGQAKDYNSIAKQSDVFSADPIKKYIQNPIFDGLDLDPNGNVIFNFTASVNPASLLYRNNLPQQSNQTSQ